MLLDVFLILVSYSVHPPRLLCKLPQSSPFFSKPLFIFCPENPEAEDPFSFFFPAFFDWLSLGVSKSGRQGYQLKKERFLCFSGKTFSCLLLLSSSFLSSSENPGFLGNSKNPRRNGRSGGFRRLVMACYVLF